MASSSQRDLLVRMTADPEGFKKGLEAAGKSAKGFQRELNRLKRQQDEVDSAMTTVGQTMLVGGAAIGVGLGLAAKAAISWESAWTGVVKTVEGSPEQMAALEAELRGLAMTLPQTHEEIAGVAAAAGQLGIARQDIAEFTKTMVDLGVSTNLTSEEAATAIARMTNIMGTAPDKVRNLASALVGLGNSSATTEAEILEMALRISGAGKTVGLTEAEVLAFSAALSSVGIEAEGGGTAISTAMIKIAEAVSEGGDSLEGFAQVAGVTADEFAQKFSTDPAQAIDMFVQGLGRMNASGGDVFGTLESLGMSEIRLRDALLRLANAGDLLTTSLGTSNTEWEENLALTEEANRRYGTTEAQLAIARNRIVDFGISIGEVLLPAIGEAVSTFMGLVDAVNGLPGPAKTVLVILAVLAAAIGLTGGAALIAVPKIHAFNVALAEMGAVRTLGALSGLASFLKGPFGIALGVAAGALGLWLKKSGETERNVDELAATFDRATGAITENTRAWIANKLQEEGAFEVAKRFGISQSELVDAVINGTDVLAEQRDRFAELQAEAAKTGGEFATLTQEEETQRAELTQLGHLLEELGGEFGSASTEAEDMAAALEEDGQAAAEVSTESQILAEQLGITTDQVDEATSASQDFDAALRALLDTMFGAKDAQAALTLEVLRATEAFDENGNSLDLNSEAGALNHQAIMGLIGANHELISAEAEAGATAEELAETTDNLRDDFIELMRQAGFSEGAIDDYADAFDNIPTSKTTTLTLRYETVGQWRIQQGVALPQQADGGYMGWANGGIVGYPHGGFVRGPGGPRTDSILARISNGEFVVNAESTRRNRDLLEAINSNRQSFASSSAVRAPMGSGGGTVRVRFDFTGVSDSMARAIRDTVKVEGNGDVQAAFGSQ